MGELVEEHWVAIDGFPNYEISNYGRVININTGRDLKQHDNGDGRFQVFLYNNGLRVAYYVHRLVAQAFFLNYHDDIEVLHKNGDRSDNTVLNLTLGGKK